MTKISKLLPPATGELDSSLLDNPNRGFRMEINVNVANIKGFPSTDGNPTYQLERYISYYAEDKPTLAQIYFYLTGYKDTPVIPSEGIDCIQANFDYAREKKVQLLVRFAYQICMYTGEGEASQEIMLSHMKQLKPLLEKNKDMIYVVQSGFLGAWGEWHSNKLDVDKTALLRGIIDMTPEGKYIHMRLPEYKNLIPKTDPSYKMLGFDNDSLFGEAHGGTGGVDPGTVPWQQITEESPYLPIDGELFWGRWSINHDGNDDGMLIDGFKIIKELSEHRFSSMSLHHNYREDDGCDGKYSMLYWKETEITEAWLNENNITYSKNWFKNKHGNTVKRNLFDFVRDYLGYKLEVQAFSAEISDTAAELSLDLINYGFSLPFGMKSGFAFLDENDNAISSVYAGEPTDWHSRDPLDYSNGNSIIHTIKAGLPVSEKACKIAFFLENESGCKARLSNDIEFLNGYNVLCNI